MNIDNDVFINAFKEEMIRSNHNSEWWRNHLSEQITNLFGSSMEESVRDAIISDAKAFIESGSLATSQYFYSTKELSDKKEIFASALLSEKRDIFNLISPDDKSALITFNEMLEIKDIYEILTSQEFEYSSKKEIANLLDDAKIRNLKENYIDLDALLKEWLGSRYEQIFGKEESKVEVVENIDTSQVKHNVSFEDDIVKNYINAADKVGFFNSIATMRDKIRLFNQLDVKEKSMILNHDNIASIRSFYHNYQNKGELLGLMDQNVVQSLYRMSGIDDREYISKYLYEKERNIQGNISKNLNHINQNVENIDRYSKNINLSKQNVSQLKNDKKDIKLNIKNSKVVIKQLEKRKEKLLKKLEKVSLDNPLVVVSSKRRLKKIQKITNNINLTNHNINSAYEQLNHYEQQLNKVEQGILNEKENIKKNRKDIILANQHIQSYALQMYHSRGQVKEVSSFHNKLVGEKTYNHNKNNVVITTNKAKTDLLSNSARKKFADYKNQQKAMALDRLKTHSEFSDKKNVISSKANTSKVSLNEQKVERELNQLGITFHPEEYVANEQNISYLPEKITSMSFNEAKMMQLYFEALYAKKMVEIAKMQQQVAKAGRSRTLSMAGFSNIFIFIISLIVLILIMVFIFVFLH